MLLQDTNLCKKSNHTKLQLVRSKKSLNVVAKPQASMDDSTGLQPSSKISKSMELESLLYKNKQKLYNFINSKCANPSDVDDLVQETYLQAILSIGRFSSKSNFSTWLLGIALNLVCNYYNRSPEYKYAMINSDILEDFESTTPNPEDYIEQLDHIDKLQIQIQSLPTLSRNMMIALVDKESSYEEIATQFSVSLSAVKSRLFRTREKLKFAASKL